MGPDLEHHLSGTSFSGVSTPEMESITVLKQTEAYVAEVTGMDALPYIHGPSDPSTRYGEEPRFS